MDANSNSDLTNVEDRVGVTNIMSCDAMPLTSFHKVVSPKVPC